MVPAWMQQHSKHSYLITFPTVLLFIVLLSLTRYVLAKEAFCPGGSQPDTNIIWCDSFENDELGPNGTIAEKYFEYNNDEGDYVRINSEAAHGQHALRTRWQQGEVSAGSFQLNFGQSPLTSQVAAGTHFTEIYWRYYMKLEDGFIGFPDKSSRLWIIANNQWAIALAAHVWAHGVDRAFLAIDPATGINNQSQLVPRQKSDGFAAWLGLVKADTPLQVGRWHCVEAHVKLNSAGQQNGVFELWLDDKAVASKTAMNWVGSWSDYGLNSLLFSNYWNGGSPAAQERYFDALVVSTARIGCLDSNGRLSPPKPPENLSITP